MKRKTISYPFENWAKLVFPAWKDFVLKSVTPGDRGSVAVSAASDRNGRRKTLSIDTLDIRRAIECDTEYSRVYLGFRIDPDTGDFIFQTGINTDGKCAYKPLTASQKFLNSSATRR